MLWYYVMRMNHWNFQYDIDSFDADSIEYLEYGPGQHYTAAYRYDLPNKGTRSATYGYDATNKRRKGKKDLIHPTTK